MSPTNIGPSRPAYKVEELLALRGSASESRVSLEKFPDEDAIKDHVLKRESTSRYSRSAENVQPPAITRDGTVCPNISVTTNFRQRNFETDPQNRAYDYGDRTSNLAFMQPTSNMNRPSPTPSLKRTKAERLIKEHGSPPHVRVTAGGRIVPSDLQQLGSPLQTARTAINMYQHGHALHPVGPSGYLGYNPYGRLIQFVDGHWVEVTHDTRGQPIYSMHSPNNAFMAAYPAINLSDMPPATATNSGASMVQQQGSAQQPDNVQAQISMYQDEYEQTRREKIELERQEVKTADALPIAQRAQIVEQKRKYVLMLDTIRKNIKELEGLKDSIYQDPSTNASISNMPYNYDGAGSVHAGYEFHGAQFGHGGMQLLPAYNSHAAPARTFHTSLGHRLGPDPTAGPVIASSDPPVVFQKPQATVSPPSSDPSPSTRGNARRSHAVQIKDPNLITDEASTGEHTSHLNPTSPSYEPGKAYEASGQIPTPSATAPERSSDAPFPLSEVSPPHFVVPAPSPIETPNLPPAELAKHWVFSQSEAMQALHRHVTHHMAISGPDKSIAMEEHDNSAMANGRGNHTRLENGDHLFELGTNNEEHVDHSSQNQTSHSSVTTTDFFPTNTHEHSFNKYMSRKASAAALLSLDPLPSTPMQSQRSELVSPVADQYYPNCPPVSPTGLGLSPPFLTISPENLRISSFLMETAPVPTFHQQGECHGPLHSPVHAETRSEFNGRSKLYLEGYLAGSSGHAPSDPKDHEYCTGYIAGLSKSCFSSVIRESSTISLKSETNSISRTPPNTTDNRSFIADLAGNHPVRHENIRFTQSVQHFSSPSGSQAGPIDAGRTFGTEGGAAQHVISNSTYQGNNGDSAPHASVGYDLLSQAHCPRSWSEDDSTSYTSPQQPNSAFLVNSASWRMPVHRQFLHNSKKIAVASPQGALSTSKAYSVTRRSDHSMCTPFTSQPSLTGYSGNQPGARVGNTSQPSVFGDDQYVMSSTTDMQRSRDDQKLHENSGKVSGRRSQYDGAMDDTNEAEQQASIGIFTESNSKTKRTAQDPQLPQALGSRTLDGPSGKSAAAVSTPPASPSKATSSPKKVTSPRHRMQQFANRVGDKVGEIFDRGNNCTSVDREGGDESPDPTKMGPEEKRRWTDGWRNKLHAAKMREEAEYRKWRKDQT